MFCVVFIFSADDSEESQNRPNPVATEETSLMQTQEQMSYRSLVLQRGLALALILFILAFGIILNRLIMKLIT